MSDKSNIEWTDATWNPVRGCTKVSPGCANCYAETFAERWRGVPNHPYTQGFDLRLVPEKLDEPLTWKTPKRIFVNSMSDLFQDGVDALYIGRVFNVMGEARQHTFQVLTKRADRMREVVSAYYETLNIQPYRNVWLGVSVENQHFADERIPLLLETPAAVRFLSCEPLLEGLDLAKHRPGALGLHWVIVGGESGAGARPLQAWWVRNIIGQCRYAGVSVFVKQLGAHVLDRNDAGFEGDTPRSWPMDTDVDDVSGATVYQGDPVRIRLTKKGGVIDEWPKDLRVREFPTRAA